MTRPRAGYVGFTRTPTSTAASGIWTLREAEASKRAAAWPDTRPVEGSDPFFASVSILLHMDGANAGTTFTDSSGTPKTITAAGNASTSTARIKFGTASALFDGSGDYLSTPSNAAYAFGTGDFTVECWVYRTSAPALASIMGVGYTIGGFGLGIDSGNNVCVTRPGTAIDHTFAGAVPMNAWSYIAITRSGTSLRCFVDGVQKGSTATSSTNYAQGELVIGMDSDKANQGFIGNIDEFRITKGTARYTDATMTVPAAAFPDATPAGGGGGTPAFAVSGAGTAAANGTYCESGTLNGRPRYIYGSYCIEYASDWIVNDESNGPAWLIRLSSTDLYYASVTTATPPLSGWAAFSGGSPAPTLSSTTC